MGEAWYNEIDPKAAAWLRELIKRGLIAPGVVDERSIEDIRPAELAGFTQCHFFAGIGVWSYALRSAGWPDSRPVWTGSCPCQPFSQAGKGAGTSDERHLWPSWFHLIGECRPTVVFGEQVASKAADSWADLVQDDLEAMDYAFGAVPFPAASVGAPHIRDRLYWMAHLAEPGWQPRRWISGSSYGRDAARLESGRLRDAGRWRLADDHDAGRLEHAQRDGKLLGRREEGAPGSDASGRGELGDAGSAGSWRHPGTVLGSESGAEREVRSQLDQLVATSRLGHHHHQGLEGRGVSAGGRVGERTPWTPSDFVWCRDEKWRPIEPGTFPLAHGAPARVGRLRGYGNAIVAHQAQVFIEESGLL